MRQVYYLLQVMLGVGSAGTPSPTPGRSFTLHCLHDAARLLMGCCMMQHALLGQVWHSEVKTQPGKRSFWPGKNSEESGVQQLLAL